MTGYVWPLSNPYKTCRFHQPIGFSLPPQLLQTVMGTGRCNDCVTQMEMKDLKRCGRRQ